MRKIIAIAILAMLIAATAPNITRTNQKEKPNQKMLGSVRKKHAEEIQENRWYAPREEKHQEQWARKKDMRKEEFLIEGRESLEERDAEPMETRTPSSWYMIISEPGYYELTEDIINCTKEYGIYINASDVVLDGKGHILDGVKNESSMYGIYVNHGANITIKNIIVQEWSSDGIYIGGPDNTIINCTIQSNTYGISLDYSNSNTIANNTIQNNSGDGIYLWRSSNNNIVGNTIRNNAWSGVYMHQYCYMNTIAYNTIKNNGGGICILISSNNNTIESNIIIQSNSSGICLSDSNNNIIVSNVLVGGGLYVHNSYNNNVESNIVNERPIVYMENQKNKRIDIKAGQIILVCCENITIENQNITNVCVAIELWRTSNTKIVNNTMQSNYWNGIRLLFSSNNTIEGNTIRNNGVGTHTVYAGIIIYYSNNNTVAYNTIQNNTCGILLYSSNDNTIESNTIQNNKYGIDICYSNNNTVVYNTIQSNGDGIYLHGSNNTIYLNNIINNTNQYSIFWGSGNRFHSPEPVTYKYMGKTYINYTGNYWSDYTGEDKNRDGIGDTPYGLDQYPLMEIIRIVDGEIIIGPIVTAETTIEIDLSALIYLAPVVGFVVVVIIVLFARRRKRIPESS